MVNFTLKNYDNIIQTTLVKNHLKSSQDFDYVSFYVLVRN